MEAATTALARSASHSFSVLRCRLSFPDSLGEANLLDTPGKPPRWQARGTAVTGYLTDRDTTVMIKDALAGFPGPTYQKKKKWR
jgi:hypothetical protein